VVDWERATAAAEKLARIDGVIGVFWGHRQRAQKFVEEEALSAHVVWKRDPSPTPLLPTHVDGYPVDVVDIGRPTHRAGDISCLQPVLTPSGRRSTASLAVRDGSKAVVLLSGHGTLGIENGQFSRRGAVQLIAPSGARVEGKITKGFVGGRVDHAVGVFELRAFDRVLDHPLARTAPAPVAREVKLGQRVTHFTCVPAGRLGPGIVHGHVRGLWLTPLRVWGAGGTTVAYTHTLFVHWSDAVPFSLAGDSGSLVVDDMGRVVGTVVAGSGDGETYVLRPHGLLDITGSEGWRTFFRD